MRFTFQTALVSSFLLAGTSIASPLNFAALAPRGDPTLVGCYSSSDSFTNSTTYTYQSQGWCQDYCTGYDAGAFALTNGDGCSCGNELPPSSDKVDTSKCSTKCDGWPSAKCGGSGYYSIYTLKANVGTVSTSGSSSSSSSNNSTATQTNSAGQTVSTNSGGSAVTVTAVSSNEQAQQSASQEATKEHNDHNTAAIAAGVVVGVVGLAALAGAIFFFYRSRKQKAQGYRGRSRGSVGQSMSDSRFDGQFMAQRRQSNGSIDDDHDFSRRILQVTNPDR